MLLLTDSTLFINDFVIMMEHNTVLHDTSFI